MTDKPRVRVYSGDSLTNVVANLGTQRDKRSHSQFGFSFVTQWQLEAAYQGNFLARRIVDVPNEDALREWRTFNGEEAKKIALEEKRVGLQDIFLNGSNWSDLYGGAGILMITDQDLTKPLDLKKVKKGSLIRLIALDRWDLQPLLPNYTDPISANYMLPEFYSVVGGTTQIHWSHVIRLEGSKLPRRLAQIEQGWGDSRLRRCMEDLRDVIATKGGIASLVLEANVDTITRQGLASDLASSQCDAITDRYRLFGMMKSVVNLALLDGEEKMERMSLSFSGLSQIMEQFMVWTAGAAEMPVTKLWGQSASGLNATGEGDMKTYYDSIKNKQEGRMRRQLEQLDQVLVRSALGAFPEDLEFEWNPLYQASGIEQAQQDLAEAQADGLNIENGVIKPSHVMLKYQAQGKYDITDEQIVAQQEREDAEEDLGEGLPDFALGASDEDEPGPAGQS